MSRILLVIITLLSVNIAIAQTYNPENLTVSRGDLTTSIYDKDTTANAFYIYEAGYSRYEKNADFNLVTDYSAKIKILNEKAYDNATIKIWVSKSDNDKEKISKIRATTYFLNNGNIETAELSPDHIFTEENEKYDIISFTFPSLTPGAVLVYSYTKESPFIFNFETWYFQGNIPKAYSKFESKIPGNYHYNIKKVGYKKLDSHEEDIVKNCINFSSNGTPAECLHSTFIITDIPAFVEEEYLTSRNNFINRLEFELQEVIRLDGTKRKFTKSWDDVDKEIIKDESIGRQLKRTSLINDILPAAIKAMPTNLEKANAIYNFVKNSYKWNEEYHIFYDVDLRDLVEEKTGNISSLNILLHNLYEEEGFKVKPVLSSTRNNGLPTKLYPVLSEFNYLIVHLDLEGKSYLLDTSEKYLPFGELPFRALNSYARLIDLDGPSEWIDIETSTASTLAIRDSISIRPDGTSIGHSEHLFLGHRAINVRNKLDKIDKANIPAELSYLNEHTRTISVDFYNKDLIEMPVTIEYDLENNSQKINDLIYFNPFSFKFFESNPFKLSERTYPIDFGYKQAFVYSLIVSLPENHSVVELPEEKLLKLPDNAGSLYFIVQQMDEKTIGIQCRLNLYKPSYTTEFYPYLKEFMSTVMDIQNSSYIVVKENI